MKTRFTSGRQAVSLDTGPYRRQGSFWGALEHGRWLTGRLLPATSHKVPERFPAALALAATLHVAIAGLAILIVSLRLPPQRDDAPVIEIVPQTTPQNSLLAPPPPQVQTAELPMPPPPPPAPPRPLAPLLAALPGTPLKAARAGTVTVRVTRPAVPDSDNEAPDYPLAARMAGEQGQVNFTVLVSPAGTAEDVMVTASSGYPDLDANARRAAMGWHFQPALADGRPVTARLNLWIRFEAD